MSILSRLVKLIMSIVRLRIKEHKMICREIAAIFKHIVPYTILASFVLYVLNFLTSPALNHPAIFWDSKQLYSYFYDSQESSDIGVLYSIHMNPSTKHRIIKIALVLKNL